MDECEWQLILGPPGTGKTTKLISILRERLSAGVPPDRVGFVTFTRQGAAVAQERVCKEFNITTKDLPHFRTLHSLCMRYAGLGKGSIIEGERMDAFAEWIGENITGRVAVDGIWSGYARGDRMLFMDNLARIRRVPLRKLYESDHDDLNWSAVERFSRGLAEYKRENKLHDFTDMLELFIKDNKRPVLDVLLVDEAQDLSVLQWDVVRALARDCPEVYVAGDDDQAIFQWAGADVDTLIDLPSRSEVLGVSYRVPHRVQLVANRVIGAVHKRRPKNWLPRDAEGAVRHVRSIEDVEFGNVRDPRSLMILSRNRHLLDPVERELRAAGVLYSREGLPSVRQATIDAIVTWERLRRGVAQQAQAVAHGPYEMMSAGVGVARGHKRLPTFAPQQMVTIEDLKQSGGLLRDDVWHTALDRMLPENRLYLMKCRRNGERLSVQPRVNLSTIHSAKGGEADRVALLTDVAPRTWQEMHVNPDAERRVLFVGLTRAREELIVIAPRTPRHYEV